MRKLRDILRLKYETQLQQRAIAQACGLGLGTVNTYLQRAAAAGLTWPLPEDVDDAALETRLFTRPTVSAASDRALPDWATLHQERKRPMNRIIAVSH
jgi:DNA-binding transcriptional regulator LsrR (DeoR family)